MVVKNVAMVTLAAATAFLTSSSPEAERVHRGWGSMVYEVCVCGGGGGGGGGSKMITSMAKMGRYTGTFKSCL